MRVLILEVIKVALLIWFILVVYNKTIYAKFK